MTDRCAAFVAAVHAELAKPELHGSVVPHLLGAKKWNCNGSPPVVRWKRGRIQHDAPKKVGGDTSPIYTRSQTLIVRVWAEADERFDDDASEAAAELLFDNLIRAARIVAGGADRLFIGEFEWLSEEKPGWLVRGAAIEGFLVADLDLPGSPYPTVTTTILTQTHTEALDPDE